LLNALHCYFLHCCKNLIFKTTLNNFTSSHRRCACVYIRCGRRTYPSSPTPSSKLTTTTKDFRASTLSSLPVTQEFNISPTFAHFRYDINAAGERALFQNRIIKKIALQLIKTT
jgi:hypothetical protein